MKGRNPRLILLRNQQLVKRYYYWYEVQNLRRDKVLETLSECEFFLEEVRIQELISQNSNLLKELKATYPNGSASEKQLREYQFTSLPENPRYITGNLFQPAMVANG
jgi:hypothetical protein